LVHTTLYDADVIGRVAARRRRIPAVTSLVNASYGPEHRADPAVRVWKLRAAQALDALTARLAIRMHAVSDEVADRMAQRLAYPRRRIVVVPRGRDALRLGVRSTERRGRARAALGLTDDESLILAVARQEYQKGLDVLVAALTSQSMRDLGARVLVAGRGGSHTDALHAAVARAGLTDRVTFLGARGDVAELLCAADVFVLPSRREGFPGAVLEAMALEAPIVATDIPQTREVVGTDSALLVPSEAPGPLGDAIFATLDDAQATARRVCAARDRFLQRFTTQAVAAQMAEFYRQSADGGAHDGGGNG
jgi:glycosyltransferase involved in cell wall biosynthesis